MGSGLWVGAIVDGFPRTKVQVECLKLFHAKLDHLRALYRETDLEPQFPKPQFHIMVLFIDENESVKRQLLRGQKVHEYNEKVRLTGVGQIVDVRTTDLDEDTAHNRYRTFKEQTYESLKSLREIFHYHLINSHGSIEEVQERIIDEMPEFTEQAIAESDGGGLTWLLSTLTVPSYPAILHGYGTIIGTGNAIVEWPCHAHEEV